VRIGILIAALGVLATLEEAGSAIAKETRFSVNPDAGNNAFTAVFDSAVGERITAVSSAVGCTLTVDEQRFEGRAVCTVPLPSIRVDNDDTKSEHFREWATNKKLEPTACTFELEIPRVTMPATMKEKTPTPYTTEGTFTLCGRKRDDGRPERITGTVTYLPPGSYGDARTLRIRARVAHFNRERYGVSPKHTAGWLARVQELAPVVASDGTIDVSLFATSPAPDSVPSEDTHQP